MFIEGELTCTVFEPQCIENGCQIHYIFSFNNDIQLLLIDNVFVHLFHFMKHCWSALLKSLLMCVLLWSWAVSRVDSEECLNEVYSQCHLCRERFKWCVCEKSFSHIWAEDFEHMNCHCSHAHFSVHLICCYSFSSYVLIDDHRWENFLLLEWLKWVDNVLHNVSDMILIELFDDDDYGSWLFEQMLRGVFCIRLMFKKTSVFTRQLLHKLIHLVVLIGVVYLSFSELMIWIQMMLSLL